MDPVQEQLEAYNARDLERFLACYAQDVVIEDGAGNLLMKGHEEMRKRYGPMFAEHPDLHCRIANRIRINDYVVDEERITGRGPAEVHAVAIYRVAGDLITHVRFLR
ncbi:MAG TPA: nuclear transport factor 2 family protein [Symbiobacteriaceae bacterium]|nr:nuclear transport factor 2 family protein [Symbiobacteriaceae bacterium]